MSPSQLLASFFLTCFSDYEMRQWLRLSPRREALQHHLPGEKASIAEVTYAAAELLFQRGYVDDELLGPLTDARPGRHEDVQMLGVVLGLYPALATSADDIERFLRRTVGDELRVLMGSRCEGAALDRLLDATHQVSLSPRVVREAHTLSAAWRQLDHDARRKLAVADLGSERAHLRERLEAHARSILAEVDAAREAVSGASPNSGPSPDVLS